MSAHRIPPTLSITSEEYFKIDGLTTFTITLTSSDCASLLNQASLKLCIHFVGLKKMSISCQVMFQKLLRSNDGWVNSVDTSVIPPTKSTAVNVNTKCSTLTPTLPCAPTLVGQWTNVMKNNST